MEGIDKNTFRQIFHDHWDTFRKFQPRFDSPDYTETVQKMLDCGDPEKVGFVQYRCCYCGETRRIAFTCKSVSYIPYDMMHKKWQYHLLKMLRKNISDPNIEKDIDRAWADYPKGFVAFLQAGEVPPGGQGLAQYLAKYVVSPPISVRRIERYDGKFVNYWYRDHKTGQIEHETLPVLRFIGRMVQHILPKGFQRIRYYGLHGNVRCQKMREHLAQTIPADIPIDPRGYRVLPAKPFQQRFFESFGKAPLLCPKCGSDMLLELISHPKYGTIKEFLLFEELPSEPETIATTVPGRAMDRTERLVQISLPFL